PARPILACWGGGARDLHSGCSDARRHAATHWVTTTSVAPTPSSACSRLHCFAPCSGGWPLKAFLWLEWRSSRLSFVTFGVCLPFPHNSVNPLLADLFAQPLQNAHDKFLRRLPILPTQSATLEAGPRTRAGFAL